jgi:O-methyltransferase
MTFRTAAKKALDTIGMRETAQSVIENYHQARMGLRQAMWDRSLFLPPLVDAAAFQACAEGAIGELEHLGHEFGQYLEFGVSRGTSLAAMHRATQATGHADMRLIGFDSFAGLPPEAKGQGWEPGEFRSPIAATRRYLRRNGVDFSRTKLVKGWFSETLTPRTAQRCGIERASLVMIDCDIYSAACEALDFCGPRIADHAVILFDDWGWSVAREERGEREAFAEFLDRHGPFETRELPTYFEKARVFLVSRT